MSAETPEDCIDDSFFTTYRTTYKAYKPEYFPKIVPKKPQRDEMVLTGHFRNNLQVNGRQMKSKVWPESNFGVEEYKDFLERLQRCKKLVHDLFFGDSTVNTDVIEEMLKDMERTVYQASYSPNEYVTVSKKRRIEMERDFANMKYHETTYRTYYNRIEDLERFKNVLKGRLCKDDREAIKRELRKIYKTGRTTYYDTICLPVIALDMLKRAPKGPVDQYTYRRI